MSQHDMTLDNASGLSFRADANNALQALASLSSGAAAPSPTFPCQQWADTGTGRLKRRNAANSAWLDEGPLDAALRDAASQGEYVADTGAAGAYVCNFVPALTARSESTPLRFKAANANPGACTINDGLGTVALVGGAHSALQGGEIIANGIAWIQWNASIGGGSYVLLFCTGAAEQVGLATKSQHAMQLGQASGVVGTVRNLKMSVAAASVTAALTADVIIVETALGGLQYRLAAFNKSINLATTGAGGIDTGSAPASSFVGLYAIYNPTTQTTALLAQSASGVSLPSTYSGANMPSGYTASALVSVWPTNASGLLIIGCQSDRLVTFAPISVLSTSTAAASPTLLSIAGAVPKNAVSCSGVITGSFVATGSGIAYVGADSNMSGQQGPSGAGPSGQQMGGTFSGVPIKTAQTIYYSFTGSNITGNFFISGYTF